MSAEVHGPRAWVVLAATFGAAAVVIGGVVGYLAWQDDDEAAPRGVETSVDDGEPSENQLFRRTTDAGIEVRARLVEMGAGGLMPAPGGGAAGRPPWCDIVGDLTAWAIGPDSVAQGNLPWTQEIPDALFPGIMWDGFTDVDSVLGVVLQVGADVESVRLTGPDGTVDEMAPVKGAVVLAVPVAADADFDPFSGRPGGLPEAAVAVVARRVDGTSLRASPDAMTQGHPAWSDPQCVGGVAEREIAVASTIPANSLPEPGVEQPADPAGAQAEIEATFGSLYGPRNPDADQLIDDPYGLDVARQQVDANGFGDDAEAAGVAIDELMFVTATDAVFRYTLTTPITEFPDQVGRARLIDGVWKITRATVCQDLAKAGATCPP